MEKILPGPNPPLSSEDRQILLALYERCRSEWQHYDSHIWQIPSLAIALNTFLLGQAFNPDLLGSTAGNQNAQAFNFLYFRGLIVMLAAVFTFVLLVALVKHRLHQRAKDRNISDIECALGYRITSYDFSKKEVIREVDPHPSFIQLWLGPLKTNHWLMGIMGLTIVIDIVLLTGIFFRWW